MGGLERDKALPRGQGLHDRDSIRMFLSCVKRGERDSLRICSEGFRREGISLLVSPQRIRSTNCCSLRLSPIPRRTCRFCRIQVAELRNSAAESRGGNQLLLLRAQHESPTAQTRSQRTES